jgi:hypothetical protein
MEDNQKKEKKKMEDNLKKFEDNLKNNKSKTTYNKNGRRPNKKWKTTTITILKINVNWL